ncbi:hypothetical protein ACJDU8_21130 [Clostridium sp. WILCCON 0269]|uniref:DUF4829 domain-containing protein n=1 Tax=Candidatus Clostridium eludens TaxID=3381663 RepID=A0ABW8SRU2_9CLOT
MKIKRFFIATNLLLILILSFTGCQPKFNEDTAKTDSKLALQAFLSSHKNEEILVSDKDTQKVKEYVSKNFKDYFTSDFMTDTCNKIETGYSISPETFYFEDTIAGNIIFQGNYLINSPIVDKENKTVTYKILKQEVLVFEIQMKQENGKWKINKASEPSL